MNWIQSPRQEPLNMVLGTEVVLDGYFGEV